MNGNIKKFDAAYRQFLNEESPKVHKKAVETLLAQVGLKKAYKDFLREPESVKSFFMSWERAGEEETNPEEAVGLKQIGRMSKKLYENKDYRGLAGMFFNITLNHFAEFAKLQERSDFETITDHDLYEKDLIPSEIFSQFFILETPYKRKDFRWNRGEEIANQNLACLAVCFGDIYEFFNYKEESAEMLK